MTDDEHLLQIVAEECAEVAQRVSKALRFGLTEVQPGQPFTNAERIMVEFDDLYAVIVMCQDRGLIPGGDMARISAKKTKVEKYMEYAKEQGTIT